MSEVSAILALPYLQPAQAQKHVTHNEALRLLDVLVQLTVTGRHLSMPPASPVEGTRHIVGPVASGAWAGHAGDIAVFLEGAWTFLTPRPGWQAAVLNEGTMLTWNGSDWTAPLASLPLLGINTAADSTNRLAVASDATLLTHAGGGHQLKLNKAAAADTSSLLFQTGFSGRAEMGLAGSDDFSVKVSTTGTAWTTALTVSATDGRVIAPAGLRAGAGSAALPGLAFDGDPDTGLTNPAANQIGLATGGVQRALLTTSALQIDVPVTGTAVQSSNTDATSGRLLRVGSFGLGGGETSMPNLPTPLADATIRPGLYQFYQSQDPLGGNFNSAVLVLGCGFDTNSAANLFLAITNTGPGGARIFAGRKRRADAAIEWSRLYTSNNVTGTVSQSGGVPTGAVIERGSNANGEYVRFADGTQICTRANLTLTRTTTTLLSATWTWPAAFVSGATLVPSLLVSSDSAHRTDVALGELGTQCYGAQTTSSGVVGIAALGTATFAATAQLTNVRVKVTGRWF